MTFWSPCNFKHFIDIGQNIPNATNFIDLLKRKPQTEIAQYKFWLNDTTQATAAFSSDETLSLYSAHEPELINNLLQLVPSAVNPKMLIANEPLNQNIEKFLKINSFVLHKFHPFAYFQLSQPKPNQANEQSVHMLRASQSDQQIFVNQWYQAFNSEQGANWSIPKIHHEQASNLYLFFKNGQFCAGVANSLFSNERLWIGRLWVKPEFRRQGIAEAAMNKIAEFASQNHQTVDLLVDCDNHSAIQL